MQNTSAAFVHVAALLQAAQIKQETPSLPPASQDTKGFAADGFFCMHMEPQFLTVNLDLHQQKRAQHFFCKKFSYLLGKLWE